MHSYYNIDYILYVVPPFLFDLSRQYLKTTALSASRNMEKVTTAANLGSSLI